MTVSDKLDTSSSLVLIGETTLDGEISVDWSEFKAHMKIRLEENYQYFKTRVHAGVDPGNKKLFLTPEDKDELNNQIEQILILISNMPSQPFTLQRICELLSEPNRHHPTLPRYLRAVTKLCRVPTRPIDLGSDDIDVDEVALSMVDIEREKRTWRSGSEPPPPKRARSDSPDELNTSVAYISQSVPNSPRPNANLNGHQVTTVSAASAMETESISQSSDTKASSENNEPSESQVATEMNRNDSEMVLTAENTTIIPQDDLSNTETVNNMDSEAME